MNWSGVTLQLLNLTVVLAFLIIVSLTVDKLRENEIDATFHWKILVVVVICLLSCGCSLAAALSNLITSKNLLHPIPL
jgi:threonine/homoserine/homoserine lactone efflux protein